MSLLTYARYVSLAGDSTSASATVLESIDYAETEIARFLRRPLPEGLYTDKLVVWPDSRVYPKAVPLVSVPASASYVVDDEVCLLYAWPDTISSPFVGADLLEENLGWSGYAATSARATVTYTGGWTLANAPLPVLRAIAFMAKALANPGAQTPTPPGVASMSVGDVSVTYRNGSPDDPIDEIVPGLSRMLGPFRWREELP